MRRLLMFLSLVLSGTAVVAAPVDNQKYVWSYAAVADVTNDMYKYCARVQLPELTKHADFLVQKNAYASKAELVRKCILDSPFFDAIDLDKESCKEHLIMPGTIYSVGNKKSDGCNLFITNLIDRQAKIKKQYSSPGTYVRNAGSQNGKSVYVVDNVVLAPGYRDAAGNTDYAVNTNDNNTNIYLFDGGRYVQTGLHTWTNDMFMNIQNGNGDRGMVRGARRGAYIYYDEDMTGVLYDLYNKRRGRLLASVANAVDSRPGGTFDIKEHYRNVYKVSGQDNGQADGNGFLFRGKIATLDFLGNVLYGMNAQEATIANGVADFAAERVSNYSTPGASWNKLWTDGENESQWVKTGWQIGNNLVVMAEKERNTKFANTQTAAPQDAYDMAAREVRRLNPNAGDVKCTGNCKHYGGDDTVVCLYSGNVTEFIFDDICNGTTKNVPIN